MIPYVGGQRGCVVSRKRKRNGVVGHKFRVCELSSVLYFFFSWTQLIQNISHLSSYITQRIAVFHSFPPPAEIQLSSSGLLRVLFTLRIVARTFVWQIINYTFNAHRGKVTIGGYIQYTYVICIITLLFLLLPRSLKGGKIY